ncbi:LamG domain-containing protein [Candidatus Haliotispira prima]|uniref:LamG domain-containing protein n=1 Tax=Candidatus Haliotispira prima TaxID=3034016 RepID=A0ABY8ME89_9SPIO|nr:LamG domain-containing protein [Candidatus Haliotispira prima]
MTRTTSFNFNGNSLCKMLSIALLVLYPLTGLYAEDILILNDGRTLRGSISSMNDDTIVFYDAQAESQRRIPKASVVGGRFGDAPLNAGTVPENIVQSSRHPLIHLPFDQSFENLGSETAEIVRNGTIPFSDDPRNEPKKAVLSTGSGSYVRIKTTPVLNTLKEFSISFWFRSLDTHRPQYLVSKWEAAYLRTQTADGMFTIGYTNPGGRLFIFLVDQNGGYHPYPIDNAIQDNLSWNHVVITLGNQQLNVYTNGNLVSSSDITYELYQDNNSDILLMTAIYRDTGDGGKVVEEDLSTFNLIGQMDDFRLRDQAITSEDVRSLYRNSYTVTGY